MSFVIHQGDALAVLRTLQEASVHCCITSPPYWGLRDYGTATWEGGSAECDHKRVAGRTACAERQIAAAAKKTSRSGSIPEGSGLKPKDLIGIPWRVALALQADGWWLRSDILEQAEPNAGERN